MKTFTGPGPLSYFLLLAFLSLAGAGLVILIVMLFPGCNTSFAKPVESVTVAVPNLVVHIVGSKEETPCKAEGCAKWSEIWIVGYRTSRGIEVDNWVLGHELRHVLNTWNLQFADPD